MTTEERVAKIMGDGRFAMDAMLDVPIREAIASEIRAAVEEAENECQKKCTKRVRQSTEIAKLEAKFSAEWEREACAKVVEAHSYIGHAAAAIRARGEE